MLKKILLTASIIFVSAVSYSQERVVRDLEKVGKFDNWTVRIIEESAILGGKKAVLYEPSMVPDTIYGRKAYVNPKGCYWRTSNAYADILGITKTSTSVFPEKRGNGYCARLEVRMADVKVFGVVNMDVVCQGSMYIGSMHEPIHETSNAQDKLKFGVPFKDSIKALQLDYKAIVGCEAVRATGFSKMKNLGYKDYADIILILQYRWEDSNGNVYAKRVGTAYERITESIHEWKNSHQIPVKYGNITSDPSYRQYMGLISEDQSNYTINSRGENVPVHEVGWASPGTRPNYLMIRVSSSCGEAFYGAPGNTVWIDNVKLIL